MNQQVNDTGSNTDSATQPDQTIAEAVEAERSRISSIMKAGSGKDQTLVQHYIDDGVSAELAEKWLASMPDANKGFDLDAMMEGTNPNITNDLPDRERDGQPTDSDDVIAGVKSAIEGLNR